MRGWRRKAFSTAVAVISAASIAQLSDAGVAKAAAPALPVSSGTATVVVVPSPFNGSQAFTLNGSIAVGNGIFNGTASGTATGPYVWGPAARNPVPPFTLEGPSLTGTCSGQWLADPTGFRPVTVDPTGLTSFPPPPPVNVVSLSCALQLGLAAPAQTSLTLAVLSQNAPTDSQFSGAFGPGVFHTDGRAPLARDRGCCQCERSPNSRISPSWRPLIWRTGVPRRCVWGLRPVSRATRPAVRSNGRVAVGQPDCNV
jgi:hypothetical protein